MNISKKLIFLVLLIFSNLLFCANTFTEFLNGKFAAINTQEHYASIREQLKSYGIDKFKEEMIADEHFGENSMISSKKNPLAKIMAGEIKVGYSLSILADNGFSEYVDKYFIAKNTPINDENWLNPEHAGKSSMSLHHEFLLIKDLKWDLFNALTFALSNDTSVQEVISMLEEMKKVATNYAKKLFHTDNIGLFFHVYPSNSVQSLHLHILDMDNLGPSFYALQHKNMPLDLIIEQLRKEAAL